MKGSDDDTTGGESSGTVIVRAGVRGLFSWAGRFHDALQVVLWGGMAAVAGNIQFEVPALGYMRQDPREIFTFLGLMFVRRWQYAAGIGFLASLGSLHILPTTDRPLSVYIHVVVLTAAWLVYRYLIEPIESQIVFALAWIAMVMLAYNVGFAGLYALNQAVVYSQPLSFERFLDVLGRFQFEVIGTCAVTAVSAVLVREIRRRDVELERRVQERTRELRAANAELGAFAYSISHDLRVPLRGIDGFSYLLVEDYQDRLDDRGVGYVDRIRAGVRRMAQLIDDLLLLSRISRTDLRVRGVDLSSIAEEIVAELRQSNPQRTVAVSVEPGLCVRADPRLLRSFLENLIDNAWKFTSTTANAEIVVGSTASARRDTREQANGRVFFVRDNGVGFDMAHAGNLFGEFRRLRAPDEFAGTGIGLAVARRILSKHGGRIWAKAEIGKGATFFFTVPHVKD